MGSQSNLKYHTQLSLFLPERSLITCHRHQKYFVFFFWLVILGVIVFLIDIFFLHFFCLQAKQYVVKEIQTSAA